MVNLSASLRYNNGSVYHHLARNHLHPMGRDRGIDWMGNDNGPTAGSRGSYVPRVFSPSLSAIKRRQVVCAPKEDRSEECVPEELPSALPPSHEGTTDRNSAPSIGARGVQEGGSRTTLARTTANSRGGISLPQLSTDVNSDHQRPSNPPALVYPAPQAACQGSNVPAAPSPLSLQSSLSSCIENSSARDPSRDASRDALPSHLAPLSRASPISIIRRDYQHQLSPLQDRGNVMSPDNIQRNSCSPSTGSTSSSPSRSYLVGTPRHVEGHRESPHAPPLQPSNRAESHSPSFSQVSGGHSKPVKGAGGGSENSLGNSFLHRADALPPLETSVPPLCATEISREIGNELGTPTLEHNEVADGVYPPKKSLPPLTSVVSSPRGMSSLSTLRSNSPWAPQAPTEVKFLPQKYTRKGRRPSYAVVSVAGSPKLQSTVHFSSKFPNTHYTSQFTKEDIPGILSTGCKFMLISFSPPPSWSPPTNNNEKDSAIPLGEKVKPKPAFTAVMFSPQSKKKKWGKG